MAMLKQWIRIVIKREAVDVCSDINLLPLHGKNNFYKGPVGLKWPQIDSGLYPDSYSAPLSIFTGLVLRPLLKSLHFSLKLAARSICHKHRRLRRTPAGCSPVRRCGCFAPSVLANQSLLSEVKRITTGSPAWESPHSTTLVHHETQGDLPDEDRLNRRCVNSFGESLIVTDVQLCCWTIRKKNHIAIRCSIKPVSWCTVLWKWTVIVPFACAYLQDFILQY